MSKTVAVTAGATTYPNPYADYKPDGRPRPNPLVTLPQPRQAPGGTSGVTSTGGSSGGLQIGAVALYVCVGVILLALVAGLGLLITRRRGRSKYGRG